MSSLAVALLAVSFYDTVVKYTLKCEGNDKTHTVVLDI